jgi:L-lactate dehydrogenase complex protein LldF
MKPFEERYEQALSDPNVRNGLLDFQRGWRESRDERVAELEALTGKTFNELRQDFGDVKHAVVADWDHYLAQFEAAATAAGSTVVSVSSAEEACRFIGELATEHGSDLVVKGKSMVSEEIGLNPFLESQGITAVETDLGEWILQLADEHPSHLVMPAIHKRAPQIADVLEAALGRPFDPADIDAMVKAARTELRDRFLEAGIGLSGANALVARTGSVMLVCNEGNNRMSVALPPIHVVTAGIEKIVPTFKEAMDQVRLLARSATGQAITTYTNFVTGPRPGQKQYIVLIDNGRREMANQDAVSSALACMRCGACANVCPPYQVVGGHAFGHVYTGAIGLVNTTYHHGIEAAAGPQSLCVSCGACSTVCPSNIPLADQIQDIRRQVSSHQRGTSTSRLRRGLLRAFASRTAVAVATRVGALASMPMRRGESLRLPRALSRVPKVEASTSWRSLPALPMRPARVRLRSRKVTAPARLVDQPLAGRRVTLFLQCVADRMAPEIAVATAKVLHALGASVRVPDNQHCCGLPAFDAGEWDVARAMTVSTLNALEDADLVVTPATSCVAMLLHHAPELFKEDPAQLERVRELHGRLFDLVGLLRGPGGCRDGSFDDGDRTPVAVHRFCQATNTLGRSDDIERLLSGLAGVNVVPLFEAEVCCGFGGSVSLTAPQTAAGILQRKLDNVASTGSPLLVTDNPGCILHLRGGADARGDHVRVMHVAEYLATRLSSPDS